MMIPDSDGPLQDHWIESESVLAHTSKLCFFVRTTTMGPLKTKWVHISGTFSPLKRERLFEFTAMRLCGAEVSHCFNSQQTYLPTSAETCEMLLPFTFLWSQSRRFPSEKVMASEESFLAFLQEHWTSLSSCRWSETFAISFLSSPLAVDVGFYAHPPLSPVPNVSLAAQDSRQLESKLSFSVSNTKIEKKIGLHITQ